jgi:hypothetical protein
VAPGTTAATTTSGVRFVFGGDSRMDITKNGSSNGKVEICASNSASGPPIAVYGLKSDIGSGAFAVPAQSACITATPYPMASAGDATHCPLIQTYQDPNPAFTIYGTSYAPKSVFDLSLNNNTVQVFRWGIVARSVAIRSTGSTGSLVDPVIDVPADAPAPFPSPSLIHIDVYLCPASSPGASPPVTCTPTGTPRLRAKVQRSATAPWTMSVLSWIYQ